MTGIDSSASRSRSSCGSRPERRQVVADDHGVDAADHALARAEVAQRELAPAREAQDRARQREPERGDRPQRVQRRHRLEVRERRARARVEEVQRHLVGVERGELRGQLGALLERLAHADDPAAADLHPQLAHELQRLPALLPRVRGDDVAEVRAGGLEVVVVAVHAEVAQLLALLAGEDAERAGDVDLDVRR